MRYFKQFPSIEFPTVLTRYEFQDVSYRHDEFPSAIRALPSGGFLVVWVSPEPHNSKYQLELRESEFESSDAFFINSDTELELVLNKILGDS
jgi:hypothetical protein